jgi:hypothetical protein
VRRDPRLSSLHCVSGPLNCDGADFLRLIDEKLDRLRFYL